MTPSRYNVWNCSSFNGGDSGYSRYAVLANPHGAYTQCSDGRGQCMSSHPIASATSAGIVRTPAGTVQIHGCDVSSVEGGTSVIG